ncbi:hypothetical protein CCO03_06915 [Comamonas serinivorans]|uniref:AMP-dependent synthetase/ligase domain-containing protein n=1 Tax=Comamonas serinivorans TaxID=1082851 RepID=A0A1Y0ELC3_9BURK|nr:AMP-binding protein [Comamonas serinivorans]ARU04443.1 hypothetical protein CCO03_06915 [Comamonas serinivorans]
MLPILHGPDRPDLLQASVQAGDKVRLWLPHGLDLLTLQLAIAKVGAAWLPFDSDVPTERIADCLLRMGGWRRSPGVT